ncbi:MAG: hypothetical protein K0Q73_6280 [Paenibacillus sp.]|jgi:phage gp16-like protein|nr:hypothetical protein [Paenibacillus sp.]
MFSDKFKCSRKTLAVAGQFYHVFQVVGTIKIESLNCQYQEVISIVAVDLRKTFVKAVNVMENKEALSVVEERMKSTKDRRMYERLQIIRFTVNGYACK